MYVFKLNYNYLCKKAAVGSSHIVGSTLARDPTRVHKLQRLVSGSVTQPSDLRLMIPGLIQAGLDKT
jgi:hypothetical protein